MLKDIWEESSYKDALAAIVEKNTMRRIVKITMEARFGPLSEDIVSAVGKADEDELVVLASRAGTDTLAQIREHLGLPPAP